MSADTLIHAPSPTVVLKRIRRIDTYEVMDADLEALDRATNSEQRQMAFCLFMLGLFIPTLISFIAASDPSETATATYISCLGVTGVFSVFFGVGWLRESKERPRLLARIRSSAFEVVTEVRGPG